MSWTKRELIVQALDEIGLGSYVFDTDPEKLQATLRRLDSMMATWNNQGVRLGYPLENSPSGSDIDADSGLPDSAVEAVYLNLALRIAPTIGKQIARETKVAAKMAYQQLVAQSVKPCEMVISRLPAGAGNKAWRDGDERFLSEPDEAILAGEDGELEFD